MAICLDLSGSGGPPVDASAACCTTPVSLAPAIKVILSENKSCQISGLQELCNADGTLAGFGVLIYNPTDATTNIMYLDTTGQLVSENALPANWKTCGSRDLEHSVFCDDTLGDGTVIVPFIRNYLYSVDGTTIESFFDVTLDNVPYTVVGTVLNCQNDAEVIELCDDTLGDGTVIVPFLRHFIYRDGVVSDTFDTQLNGTSAYSVIGTITTCETCVTLNETGFLADPASVDLSEADRCQVDSVIIDGDEIVIMLAPNWTVEQFVDAVNAAKPNTLEFNGTTIVSAVGKTLSNLQIICATPTFTEDFGSQPLAGPLPGAGTYTPIPSGSTTYNFDPSGNWFSPNSYHVGRVRDARPASYPAYSLSGPPNDVDALGDLNGNAMLINGSTNPGVFYTNTATGLIIGKEYQMRAYAANAEGSINGPQATIQNPNVKLEILDGVAVLGSSAPGPLPNDDLWHTFDIKFIATNTSVTFSAINFGTAFGGNDLFLDQITFSTIKRQSFVLTPRGDVTCVEIIKEYCPGQMPTVRLFSPDGTIEYTLPDPDGRLLCIGEPVIFNPYVQSVESEQMCMQDDNGKFIRHTVYNVSNGNVTNRFDTDLTMQNAYTSVGIVTTCDAAGATSGEFDNEVLQLCDDNGTFLRTIKYNNVSGNVTSIVNTELDGTTLYVPVGTITVCSASSEFDRIYSVSHQICVEEPVNTKTQWLVRQAHIIDNVTGNITTTITEYSQDGITWQLAQPTNVSISLGTCDCCPIVLAEGCWQNGVNTGTWTSTLNADGTVTLLDPVTGLAVLPANVVNCTPNEITHTLTVTTNTVTIIPVANLKSWSIRNRNTGTVTVKTGADAVFTLDNSEIVSSSVNNNEAFLTETVTITTTVGGSFRLIYVQGV